MKLDFINLDDFLRLNPQLSNNEVADVLALDASKSKVIDRHYVEGGELKFDPHRAHWEGDGDQHVESYTGDGDEYEENWRPPTILDKEEVNNFFKRYGINYSNYIFSYADIAEGQVPENQPSWVISLQVYIFEHLSEDFFAQALNLTGFPLNKNIPVSKDPKQNVFNHLDFLEATYKKFSDNPQQFMEAQASGVSPIGMSLITHTAYYDPLVDKTTAQNMLVRVYYNPTPLFWEVANPFLTDKMLPIELNRAIDYAVAQLNENTHGVMAPNYSDSSVILFTDIPKFLELVRNYLNGEIELENKVSFNELRIKQMQEAGFVLQSDKQDAFENFITGQEFKSLLISRSEWPSELKKEFFSFFNSPFSESVSIQGSSISGNLPDSNLVFDIEDILDANGYMILYSSFNQVVILRQLTKISWREDHFGFGQRIGRGGRTTTSNLFISQAQPINTTEWERLRQIMEEEESPYFSRKGELYPSLMVLSYLLNESYLQQIKNKAPWLSPLFPANNNMSVEVLNKFFHDLFSYSVPMGLVGPLIQSGEEWDMALFLQALKKSENPEIVLAFFLYLGSLPSETGEYVREVFIPVLFSQIYSYTEDVKHKKNKWVEVGSHKSSLSNLWAKVNPEDMVILAEQLKNFSKEDLVEMIDKIKLETLTQLEEYKNFTEEEMEMHIIGEAKELKIPTHKQHNPGFIRINRLMNQVKLDSTKKELQENFLAKGEVSLGDLLAYSWSAPQREDLRLTLKKYYSWTPPSELRGIETLPEKAQIEMLSFHAIIRLITQSSIADRSFLWEALFSKNPQKAIHFYEQIVTYTSKYGFSPHGMFPSKEDLMWATPYVVASREPNAGEVLQKHRSFLEKTGMGELLEARLGEKSMLDVALERLCSVHTANNNNPSQLYRLFLDMEGLFNDYYKTYGVIDPHYFTLLEQTGHFSSHQLNYLMHLYGGDNSFSRDDLIQLWTDALTYQKPTDNRIHFLRLWQFLEKNYQAKLTVQEALIMASFVEVELINKGFGLDDVASLLRAIGESIENKNQLPLVICVGAACLGLDWGVSSLSADKLFYTSLDGKRVLKKNEELNKFVQNLSLNNHFIHLNSPLLDFGPAKPAFGPSPYRIQLFSLLRKKFGDYELGDFDIFTSDFILSYFYPDVPVEAPSLLTTGQSDKAYQALVYLNYYPPDDPISLQIRKNLKQCYETKRSLLGGLMEHESLLLGIIYPDKLLVDNLFSLQRYDQVEYPQKITDADQTYFSPEEITFFISNVSYVFQTFLDNLKILWKLKQTGYPLAQSPDLFLAQIPQEELKTPWIQYSVLLIKAIYGDKEAINQLWLYENKSIPLESDVAVFDEACQNLVAFGHELLMQVDPERFFTGSNLQTVSDTSTLAMLELAHPDPSTPALQRHLTNPIPSQPKIPEDYVAHATMVAQTLLGNYQSTSQASGEVQSYTIELTGSNWDALDKAFKQIVSDVENDPSIKVLNLSIGTSGMPAIGSDFEQLVNSPTFSSLKQSLIQLRKMNLPVVIAAGNNGSDNLSYLLGTLNWMALIDPAIILVGASDLSGKKPAEFSSEGNTEFRADVLMVGEGLVFWDNHGEINLDVAGTSFAAPFTARMIAKMREINPDLSAEAIQAILKMTSQDTPDSSPLKEGAGFINAPACLYVAFVFGKNIKKEDRKAFAQQLGITNYQELDWLAKKIEHQMFWQDTTRQAYGE